MTIVTVKPGTEEAFDLVAKMVTSSNPRQQCMGRAIASGIHQLMEKWMVEEVSRGTDPVDLSAVVAELGIQLYAGVIVSLFDAEGFGPAAQAYLNDVSNRILPFMQAAQEYRKAAGIDP